MNYEATTIPSKSDVPATMQSHGTAAKTRQSGAGSVLVWLAQFGIGLVLLISGVEKVLRPYDFLDALYGYGLLGPAVGLGVAAALPWLEIVLGACLVTGICRGYAAGVSAGLFGVFAVVLAWKTVSGESGGDCGCGGVLPGGSSVSWTTAARAAVLGGIAAVVAARAFTSGRGGVDVDRMQPAASRAGAVVGRVVFLTLVVGLTGCGGGEVGPDQAVLDAAYRHPEGQGYSGDGIGIPVDIVHAGQVVRAKEGYGTNSLGYTFAVMWEVAKKRGLLNELYLEDFETFRRDWYRADPETESRGLVGAMERVGIGYEVPFADAQPGDFLILGFYEQRGPSAVFLDWVHHEGKLVGVRYRTSELDTNGIADTSRAFVGTGIRQGVINPAYTLVGRLNRS